MKYIVCEKPGKFLLKNKNKPVRKQDEALLKINQVGICGTDIHAFLGNQAFFSYPRVLGHELGAEVLEIGQNAGGIKAGDKVVVMPYVNCGTCIACKQGKTNCCSQIEVLGVHTDGGMQEFITVPHQLLLPANELSFEQIAVIEPLAIGAHALDRAGIQKNEFVAVMGCGPIGIGILKLAQIRGARIIAMDINQDRLEFAKEKIGVDFVVNVSNDPVRNISDITGGDMATAVFDASGNKKALESGPSFMAHGGRFVLVGLSKGELSYSHPEIHARETTLMCSRNATLEDFKYVMSVIHEFPTHQYISHRASYAQMIENFDSWTRPETKVMKALVSFQ